MQKNAGSLESALPSLGRTMLINSQVVRNDLSENGTRDL